MDKITCAGCSLLCDDIMIRTDGMFIDQVIGACLKGKERFDFITSNNRLTHPMIKKDNKLEKVGWDEALEKVGEILNNSSKPLYYGFCNTTCETQAKIIDLARKTNAFLESNSNICQGKVLETIQETGTNLTTIAEVINKGDLIVLWGANPVESIPRLINKLLFSRGKFRMTGREIKTIIIVDPVKTKSFGVMQIRDLALNIEIGKDIDLINAVKEAIKAPNTYEYKPVAGIDQEDLKRFVLNLVGAENGVIILGQGVLVPHKNYNLVKELIGLIQSINKIQKRGRISLLMMGGHYNMAGFDHVSLSLVGANSRLQFSEGNLIKTEDTLISKLRNGDFDSALLLGTDPISHLPIELSKSLAEKPLIVIDNVLNPSAELADVVLPTAINGIETEGLAFRLDQVPIELKKVLNPPNNLPSDFELIEKIIALVKKG